MANTTSATYEIEAQHEAATIAAKTNALAIGALQQYAKASDKMDKQPKRRKKQLFFVAMHRNDNRFTKYIPVWAARREDAWRLAELEGYHRIRKPDGTPDFRTVERDKRKARKTSVAQQSKTRSVANPWRNIFGPHPVWYRGWELVCGKIEFELLAHMWRTLAADAGSWPKRQPVCI